MCFWRDPTERGVVAPCRDHPRRSRVDLHDDKDISETEEGGGILDVELGGQVKNASHHGLEIEVSVWAQQNVKRARIPTVEH